MYFYYIKGKKSYLLREEIKKLRPNRKDFKKWWDFSKDFKAWYLEVPNNVYSKKFDLMVRDFCKNNDLALEVLEFTKPPVKSIHDFKSKEEFFNYFHKTNNRPKL